MTRDVFSPALYAIFGALVESRTGLHYGDNDLEVFSSKVTACALEHGFESPLDYYYALRYDDPEHRALEQLCEALVVNETYFFREVDQLRALCDFLLVPMIERGERPRVWSAAAASGEEPYTLAMLLDERGLARRADISASDISLRMIEHARAGVYGARALRSTDAAATARWFTKSDDRYVVSPDIRAAVTWTQLNLVDESAVARLGSFDAILCRNVLIYFAESTIQRVVGLLTRALKPGGQLLVGASESLLRFGTLLTCHEQGGAFFYAKAP